jgi:hypothetical protein
MREERIPPEIFARAVLKKHPGLRWQRAVLARHRPRGMVFLIDGEHDTSDRVRGWTHRVVYDGSRTALKMPRYLGMSYYYFDAVERELKKLCLDLGNL